MPGENNVLKQTHTTETPAEVPLALIEFLKGVRESATNLITKHLDNEAARLRIRELEAQVELKRHSDRNEKSGGKNVS